MKGKNKGKVVPIQLTYSYVQFIIIQLHILTLRCRENTENYSLPAIIELSSLVLSLIHTRIIICLTFKKQNM